MGHDFVTLDHITKRSNQPQTDTIQSPGSTNLGAGYNTKSVCPMQIQFNTNVVHNDYFFKTIS